MKDKNILICVGIIIYIAMSGIDRFVYHIPNIISPYPSMDFKKILGCKQITNQP